jgi:hypothetical protein
VTHQLAIGGGDGDEDLLDPLLADFFGEGFYGSKYGKACDPCAGLDGVVVEKPFGHEARLGMPEHLADDEDARFTGADDEDFLGLDPALARLVGVSFAVDPEGHPGPAEGETGQEGVDDGDAPGHPAEVAAEKAQARDGDAEKDHGLKEGHKVEDARAAPAAQGELPEKLGGKQRGTGYQHVARDLRGVHAEAAFKPQVKGGEGADYAAEKQIDCQFGDVVSVIDAHGRNSGLCGPAIGHLPLS